MIFNNNSNVQLFKPLRGLKNTGKHQSAKPDSIPHLQETCTDTRSSIFNCQLETKSIQLESSLAIQQYWHLHLLLTVAGTVTPSDL